MSPPVDRFSRPPDGRRCPGADRTRSRSPAPRQAYDRTRDLPRLIPLWPRQMRDAGPAASLLILQLLRRALRAERKRARAGHWSYDLNRHLALLDAYRAECARAKDRLPEAAGPHTSGPDMPMHKRPHVAAAARSGNARPQGLARGR